MTLEDEIRSFRNPEKAAFLPHFFKTGPRYRIARSVRSRCHPLHPRRCPCTGGSTRWTLSRYCSRKDSSCRIARWKR